MSLGQKMAFGTIASWASRFASISFGLLLMPALFRHLGREEIGVWMLLGQMWSILGILDLGLTATLTRRIALVKGKCGGDVNSQLSAGPRQEIADLVESSRRVYRFLAIAVFLLSAVLGYFLIRNLELSSVRFSVAWTAWIILCLSHSINLWATVWTCLLQGMGFIGWDSILTSINTSITLLIQIVVIFAGGGLVDLALTAAIGAIAQRIIFVRFSRARVPELFWEKGVWKPLVIRSMVAPALLSWGTGVGLAVTMHTDQLFIANLGQTADIPNYRAAYLILMNLTLLAATIPASSAVFISQFWQADQIQRLRDLVKRSLLSSLIIMASGSACVLALGPAVFELWLGPGSFVGYPILLVFIFTLTMEVHTHAFSTSSRATEDEVFLVCALVSGALKVSLALVLGKYYGLLGIALSTMFAQMLTNNWYMVYRAKTRLGISFVRHSVDVIFPVIIVFVITVIVVFSVKSLLEASPIWLPVSIGIASSGMIMLIALWVLVPTRSQRKKLADRMRKPFNHLLMKH